ncbi:MAG: hypothetical protein ACWA49_13475 [Ruegeria sp.]
MIRVELLAEIGVIPEKHAFIFTDIANLDRIPGPLNIEDLLRFEEVGFFGPHSASLHDQLDDFIGDGQDGDPLTQIFSDAETLKEYLTEHSDLGVDCIILCDGQEFLSIGRNLIDSIAT